jgi:hypothetical protein
MAQPEPSFSSLTELLKQVKVLQTQHEKQEERK